MSVILRKTQKIELINGSGEPGKRRSPKSSMFCQCLGHAWVSSTCTKDSLSMIRNDKYYTHDHYDDHIYHMHLHCYTMKDRTFILLAFGDKGGKFLFSSAIALATAKILLSKASSLVVESFLSTGSPSVCPTQEGALPITRSARVVNSAISAALSAEDRISAL